MFMNAGHVEKSWTAHFPEPSWSSQHGCDLVGVPLAGQ